MEIIKNENNFLFLNFKFIKIKKNKSKKIPSFICFIKIHEES